MASASSAAAYSRAATVPQPPASPLTQPHRHAGRGAARGACMSNAVSCQPLSFACARVGDAMVAELVEEVCRTVRAQPLLPREQALLEGVSSASTSAASSALRLLLASEAKASALSAAEADAAIGSGALSSKQKQQPDMLVCVNCAQQVSVNRYAPHLERCMLGKGRASARAANNNLREA